MQGALEHLDRRPWSHEADRVVARCLSRLDFAEQAEPYYQRAGVLAIEDLHYRAYGLVRANRRDRAVAAYQEILTRHPDDVSALRLQAGVLLSQNRWDEVENVAERLTKFPPGPVTIYSPTVAAGHWTLRPTEVASVPVVGYTLVGVVNHDTRQYAPAVTAFERVLEIDPELRSVPLDQTLFWSHLSEDLLRVGRPGDVVRHLTRVTEGKNAPALLDLLGQAYFQQSSFEDAEQCWRRAVEWDPNLLSAWLNLGRLELERDRLAEAVHPLKQAVRLKPDSYEALYSLSLVCRRLGREDEAKQYGKKAEQFRRRFEDEATEYREKLVEFRLRLEKLRKGKGTSPNPSSPRDTSPTR